MVKACFLAALTFVIAAPVLADDPLAQVSVSQESAPQANTPETVQISTPAYPAYESGFEPAFGKYTYEVSWNGIPAAEGVIEVGGNFDTYKIVASAKTYPVIDILYKLRYRAEGLISAVDMTPIRTVIRQQENSKVKGWDIQFRPGGEIESVRTQKGKPDEVKRFSSNNFTLDPIAAAFLARGLSWQVGETKEFDTYNGKTRYLISLTAEEKEDIMIDGNYKTCLVIMPKVIKLGTNEPQHKLREAKIYLTDDKSRDIVKIVSSVFIGSVRTKLISFEPSSTQPPVRMAQLRTSTRVR